MLKHDLIICFDSEIEQTTEPATKARATTSGASLYIIIAIIVLVILLCALFYCTKCWRKRNSGDNVAALEKPPPTHKDAEEGKALIVNQETQNQQQEEPEPEPEEVPKTVTDLKAQEKELIDKLEPKDERTYADAVKGTGDGSAGNQDGNVKVADDHKEINSMLQTIQQLSFDTADMVSTDPNISPRCHK